jgi:regulatory protein
MKDIRYEAQAILSRRDHSEAEVRQKLTKKGFGSSDIAEVIVWLKEKKYVNDAKFARAYAESILRQKAVGPKWLAMKLKEKKIASDIIQEEVQRVFAGKEGEIAKRAAEKWKRMRPARAEDRQALMRFLLSRGFSGSAIQGVSGNNNY